MSASPRSCRSRWSQSPPTSGDGGLGRLFTEGFQRDFPTPVIVGVVLTILLATLIAATIGLPLGLLIGHTGKGAFITINLASFGRALPTVGLVVLVFLAGGLPMLPVYLALVALAVPAIVTITYAGMTAVDPDVCGARPGDAQPSGSSWRSRSPWS